MFARFLVYLFTGLHYHTRYGRNERRSSLLHLQRVNNRNDSADPKRVRDMFAAYFSNFCSLDDKKTFCETVKTMFIPFLNIYIYKYPTYHILCTLCISKHLTVMYYAIYFALFLQPMVLVIIYLYKTSEKN